MSLATQRNPLLNMGRFVQLSTLLVGLFVVSSSAAQEHQFLKRGATREALSSIDSVSLASGAGVLNIPVGPRLHVGGGLHFGLNLFYNSKAWDTESSIQSDPLLGQLPISFPSRKSTAGMGWSLSLGELIPPHTPPLNSGPRWLYIDPSGGNHFFYQQLHALDPQSPTTWYSRSGSYLRMKQVATQYHIEFPSGEVHVFLTANGKLRLSKIFNRFGSSTAENFVDVAYSTETVQGAVLDVTTATDSHLRTWKIFSSAVVLDYGGPGGIPVPIVEKTIYKIHKVEVPGFGGNVATYEFNYSDVPLDPGCAWGVFDPSPANHVSIPLLNQVLLPAVEGSMPLSWNFDYYPNDAFSYATCKQGLVKSVTLPSGGSIHWDYKALEIRPHCDDDMLFQFFWSKSAALLTREYIDIDGSSLAKWSYAYFESTPPADMGGPLIGCDSATSSPASETLTVRETTPLGDLVYHPFMIWPFPGLASEHGAREFDYFLPYIRPGIDPAAGILHFTPDLFANVAPAEDAEGRFLSRVVFDCDEAGDCEPFSARYVRYETEHPFDTGTGFVSDRNERLVSERTVYFKPGTDPIESHAVITNSSEFDGLGNFRRVETTSTFPGESSLVLTRDFNASLGVNVLTLNNHSPVAGYQMLDESLPWVLGTFTVTESDEGGEGSRMETLFDTATGFLERQRVLAATGPLTGLTRQDIDVLTVFEHSGDGNVAAVSTYGGDRMNDLENLDLDRLTLGNWEYRQETEYQAGYRRRETQVGRHGGSLVVVDVDLDTNSGLPTASREANGLQTDLDYDALGRLLRVTPPVDAETVAIRTPATAGSGEEIVLQRNHAGTLLEERFVQDGFGRNILEEVKFPDGRWSARDYEYGANGFLARLSTSRWRNEVAAGWTTLSKYDPLGRPLLTRNPDGSEVRLVVDREHSIETFFKVSTGGGPEVETSSRAKKDSRGRILEVAEPSNGGAWVTTSYQYDVGGRLSQVATPQAGGGSQVRTFNYDNRGYLNDESHPETGSISYGSYDTAGNAGTRSDGAHSLGFAQDEFGRLHQVRDTALNRLLSESFYSRTNRAGGADKALGQVVMAKRHNYLAGSGEPVTITETYAYHEAAQGRLSELRTRSNTGLDVSQTFTYDPFGNPANHGYPLQDILPGAAGPDRLVSFSYDIGQLAGVETSIDGGPLAAVVSDLSYHPQGLVESRLHSNGVEDLQTIDSSGMVRPGSIRTTGVAGGEDWISGTYAYDGFGNVKAIGSSQAFHFDEVSRLVHAEVAGITQDYQYDRFGNLLNLGGQGFSIDEETNQLDATPYDGAGNLLSYGGRSFTYDALSMASSTTVASQTTHNVYGPGNERIAVIADDGEERWSLRDPQQRVTREYTRAPQGPWIASRDYLYSDRLSASFGLAGGPDPTLDRRYHSDHLGSPRLLTDGTGAKVSGHTYLPFGEEIFDPGNPNPDGEQLKFTGQERDASDLDYLHARFYGPLLGKFMSVDPVLGSAGSPQSWNRYTYVGNNPISNVDPSGRSFLRAALNLARNPLVKPTAKKLLQRGLSALAQAAETAGAPKSAVRIAESVANQVGRSLLGRSSGAIGPAAELAGEAVEAKVLNATGLEDTIVHDALDAADIVGGAVELGANFGGALVLKASVAAGAVPEAALAASGASVSLVAGTAVSSYLLTSGALSILERHGVNTPASASARSPYSPFADGAEQGPDALHAGYTSVFGRPVTNQEAFEYQQSLIED